MQALLLLLLYTGESNQYAKTKWCCFIDAFFLIHGVSKCMTVTILAFTTQNSHLIFGQMCCSNWIVLLFAPSWQHADNFIYTCVLLSDQSIENFSRSYLARLLDPFIINGSVGRTTTSQGCTRFAHASLQRVSIILLTCFTLRLGFWHTLSGEVCLCCIRFGNN